MCVCVCVCVCESILMYMDVRGTYDKFPFFRMGTLIDSTHMKL